MPDRKNQSGIRMWSFSDMSLSAASKIGDIANIVLLISLVAGVISTFVIVKTAAVKEDHWDVLRDQARISIAEANARALEAGQKTEEEKFERVKIEQEMLKQLRPRDLSKQQIDDLVSALKGKINKKLSVHTLTDSEARSFGFVIMHVLTKAGIEFDWIRPTAEKNVFPVPGIPTGLTLYMANGRKDPEAKQLVEMFMDAFAKAGVQIAGYMPEKPLPDVPSPSLFISKRQPPFSWLPEYVAPADLTKPPWEPE
jgi:hypothetical protein